MLICLNFFILIWIYEYFILIDVERIHLINIDKKYLVII